MRNPAHGNAYAGEGRGRLVLCLLADLHVEDSGTRPSPPLRQDFMHTRGCSVPPPASDLTLDAGLWTLGFLMPLRVLIIPDKFKGTLSASAAAEAIARGWRTARPQDPLDLVPMSDGGDGFGEVTSALQRAKGQRVKTVD